MNPPASHFPLVLWTSYVYSLYEKHGDIMPILHFFLVRRYCGRLSTSCKAILTVCLHINIYGLCWEDLGLILVGTLFS